MRLNASHLKIETIGNTDLASAEHLKELDLSFNKISTINFFAFNGAGQLETLDLSHNEIQFIYQYTRTYRYQPLHVSTSQAIKRIYLNHNRLTKLEQNIFPDELIYLSLNDNQITEIGSLPTRLQTLVLDNNNALSVIPNMDVDRISLRNTSATNLIIYQSTIEIDATDSAIHVLRSLN